jgi:hypothetical protein
VLPIHEMDSCRSPDRCAIFNLPGLVPHSQQLPKRRLADSAAALPKPSSFAHVAAGEVSRLLGIAVLPAK